MKNIKIYSLNDPRNGEIRYIGKTIQVLKDRRNAHIKIAKNRRTHKDWWILSLLELKLIPEIHLLEEDVLEEKWKDREKFYIKKFNENKRLTNSTEGGDGASKRIVSDETKQKLREANLGKKHTKETRDKMSDSHKGKVFSDEHSKKIGLAHKGKIVSEETKERQRAAHKGQTLSNSAKMKLSLFNKGKVLSTETKEKMRSAAIAREAKKRLPNE